MGLTLGYLVGLTETYPEEKKASISYYLDGIPLDQVLLVVTANLAEQQKTLDIRNLLGNWFRASNSAFANEAYKRLKPIENKFGPLQVASIVGALKLYTYAFSNPSSKARLTDEQIEINLFKVFLHMNDLINSTESNTTSTTRSLPVEERLYAMHFASAIRYSDVNNYDLYELLISEFLRAVSFFEFIENRPEAKYLLEQFYKDYDVVDWRQYLKQLSGLSFSILRKGKAGYVDLTIPKDADYERNVSFLDTISRVRFDETPENDFKSVRERPLHLVEPGKYKIVSELFCVERIFKGLYFILKAVNEKLPNETKIKSFRNLYTYDFSEQHALYGILDKAFPKRFIKISGEYISSQKYQGGPDFYVRFNNKAFLFESKDSLINASLKETGDYAKLHTDLETKFYKDGKSPKAVLQLLNNIKDIFSERFKAIDPEYKSTLVRLYPILVIHDRQLDVPGFNKIINQWFTSEIKMLSTVDQSRVHPITVMDMGTLVLIHELINERKLLLENVIEEYHKFVTLPTVFRSETERKQKALDTTLPFSFFVKQFIAKRNLKRYPERFLWKTSGSALNEPPEVNASENKRAKTK